MKAVYLSLDSKPDEAVQPLKALWSRPPPPEVHLEMIQLFKDGRKGKFDLNSFQKQLSQVSVGAVLHDNVVLSTHVKLRHSSFFIGVGAQLRYRPNPLHFLFSLLLAPC